VNQIQNRKHRMINVAMTPEQHNRLTEIGKETGASLAFQIRKAIDHYIAGTNRVPTHLDNLQAGQASINDIRKDRGLEPLPDTHADQRYNPTAMVQELKDSIDALPPLNSKD
jgi:predicted DNA-binding protein